jgi:exopolyphosphatase/guanosine-5'-triphosphate,3'-diphosphate pyrophosphatase
MPPTGGAATAVRLVAVIDVGATAIRLAVAEIDDAGNVRVLDRFIQPVSIGKDTFTKGFIRKATIEECVAVLKSYRQILSEYKISIPNDVRVVATSAVREAENRMAFIDRVYSAAGFSVDPIDEAEVSRLTYVGIQSYLRSEPALLEALTLIVEVGGGNTELLLLDRGDVVYAHTSRLGSLRLRETLEHYRAPKLKTRNIIESQVQRTIEQIRQHVDEQRPLEMVALGGDVRYAASQLLPDWNVEQPGRLALTALERFTDKTLNMSEEERVKKYHLSFPDSETLGPALLACVQLARAFRVKHVFVSSLNLRYAVLKEMAARGTWNEDLERQIVRSAHDLGRKFCFDAAHAQNVADVARQLFRVLENEHRLPQRFGLILYVAALLHEIGMFVNSSSHHKHSMYLINNSDFFGLSRKDVLLVSLVARYHRRASPKPNHPGYAGLSRDERVAVAKLAAILRIADALDGAHSQRVSTISTEQEDGRLIVYVPGVEDLSVEQLALKQKGPLFEEVFGMQVLLRPARG